MWRMRAVLLVSLAVLGLGCGGGAAPALPPALAPGVDAGPGLALIDPPEPTETPTALHFHDGSARLRAERGARGVGLVDMDGDGWLDVTLTSSEGVRVLRGAGGGLFYDHPGEPLDVRNARGVAWADIEGDGDLDLYVSSSSEDRLFVNVGGALVDETEARGLLDEGKAPATDGVSFADIDGDQDLDIYVAHAMPRQLDIPPDAPPFGQRGNPNRIYLNDGSGHFTRVEEPVLAGDPTGQTFGALLFDYDGDGRQDVFLPQDGRGDQLLRHGPGGWTDATYLLPGGGPATSIMGVDVADFDGDGRLDLYGTQGDSDALWLGRDGGFESAFSQVMSGGDPTALLTGWGVAMGDLDNDGLVDVVATSAYGSNRDVGNGRDPWEDRAGWMVVLRQVLVDGARRLVVPPDAGALFDVPLDGFGLAVGDIDRDGDLDVLVGVGADTDRSGPTGRRASLLLVNDGLDAGTNRSLVLRVRQPGPNPFAVGARVEVIGRGIRAARVVTAGSSYLSQHSYAQHFGLGHYESAPIVRVRWPDGSQSVWLDLPAGEHTLERAGTCCTREGCSEASAPACIAAPPGAEQCAAACARLAACCGEVDCRCADLPPPPSVLACVVAAACNRIDACLRGGQYAFTSPGGLAPWTPGPAWRCVP